MKVIILFAACIICSYAFAQDNSEASFSKNLEKEIRKNQRILDKEPNNEQAIYNIGMAYYKRFELFTALKFFDRLIELNPQYNGAFSNRGIIKLFLKDTPGACNDFKKSIAAGSDLSVIDGKKLSEYLETSCDK